MMNQRAKINQQAYQQAVKFAENLPLDLQQECVLEAQARYQFEQAQAVKNTTILAIKRPLSLTILLCGLMSALAGGIYWQTGRYHFVQQGQQMYQAFQRQADLEDKQQKNDRYILSLQNQLRQNPNNGDVWYELGQAYALNNDFDASLICYQNAEQVLGKKAAILGAMATADYYAKHQQLSDKAKQWIDQALALDAKENNSLLLLATNANANKQYQQAINYWRQVLDSQNPAVDRRAVIQNIQMALQQL